jgi:hypothetical protein
MEPPHVSRGRRPWDGKSSARPNSQRMMASETPTLVRMCLGFPHLGTGKNPCFFCENPTKIKAICLFGCKGGSCRVRNLFQDRHEFWISEFVEALNPRRFYPCLAFQAVRSKWCFQPSKTGHILSGFQFDHKIQVKLPIATSQLFI